MIGDPYFDCDNKNLSLDQAVRLMIYDDGSDNPTWTDNPNTVLQPYFNCEERKNMSTVQVLKLMVIKNGSGNPQWRMSNL